MRARHSTPLRVFVPFLSLVAGLVLLIGGAYALVRGAAALALRFGLPPLVVGLTVVAFGTSAPELVVSVDAAMRGVGGIAVGNVIGSNIANIGLILALAALVRPVVADRSIIRRDGPLMVVAASVLSLLLLDDRLSRVEGGALLAGLVLFLAWSAVVVRRDRKAAEAVDTDLPRPSTNVALDGLLTLGGFAFLVLGAEWLVGGAVALASGMGVSEAVIGLTVVAVGTSLPELATSVVAAARGESDLAAGNVVGSNLFNTLGILGVAAVARPLHAPGLSAPDLGVMLAFVVLGLLLLTTGRRLTRAEGGGLLALYGAYLAFVVAVEV